MQLIQIKHPSRHHFKHPDVIMEKIKNHDFPQITLNPNLKKMTYLLSLLTTQFPSQESNQILCYYINDTSNNQIIRAINGVKCHFERIVFSGERLLFEAMPDSYLEVYSPSRHRMHAHKVDCRSLHINQKNKLIKSAN